MLQKLQNHQLDKEGSIDYIISTVPKVLDVNDSDIKKVGDYYLPFSTGFEIECFKSDTFNVNTFKSIPYIMDVNVDSHEQRFRIPSGIKGLHCLYDISTNLRRHSLSNPLSGIHYHVDFTSSFDKITEEIISKYKENILKELDTWNYKGEYNKRNIGKNHYWVRLNTEFKTLEFRIGEMTFDYPLLFKRIAHCNSIVFNFKNIVEEEYYIKNNLEAAYEDDINNVLKNRITKLDM